MVYLHIAGASARGDPPAEAVRRGAVPITIRFADVDRSVIDGESTDFCACTTTGGGLSRRQSWECTPASSFGYFASAMRRGGRLGDLAHDVFPYPTLADAVRKAGDAYRRTRLTPVVSSLLRRYFALVRKV